MRGELQKQKRRKLFQEKVKKEKRIWNESKRENQ